MNKSFFVLYILCVLSFGVTVNAQEVSMEEAEKDSTVLRVVGKCCFPPYEYLDSNNRPAGMGVELFREVMKKVQQPYVLEMLPAPICLYRMNTGEADIMLGTGAMAARRNFLRVSVPFAYVYPCFVCPKESPILTTSDLSNRRVAMGKGLWGPKRLAHIPGIQIVCKSSPAQALQATASRETEVTVLPTKVAEFILKEYDIKGLEIRNGAEGAVNYCMAVTGTNAHLLQSLNRALQELRTEGKYHDIYKKWNQTENTGWTREQILMINTSVAWLIVSIVVIVLLVVLLRKRLKKERDINQTLQTQQKQLADQQYQLEQKQFLLEQKQRTILKINKDLEKQVKRAEMANQLKTNFLANMSHEIRTPLNSIIGFTDVLIEDKSLSPDEANEYVDIIHTNNDLLLHLINDILDLSKLEAGFMEKKFTCFDITKLIHEEYKSMISEASKKQLTTALVSPEESCIVHFDKDRLAQVLNNFITNALKYTEAGRIELGYEILEHGVRVYVTDTGVGIPKDEHDKVFMRFEKLNAFAQGTGLGLSICKAIVDNFEGQIGFESAKGAGSTFWAVFPCKVSRE